MKTETIAFRISISDFDPEMSLKLKSARGALQDLEYKIISSFSKSERFKAMCDLAGDHESGSKMSVVPPKINGAYIEAQATVKVVEPDKVSTPYFSIPEKTANLLLTGKLLSDDQKKALVKRMGFDLDSLAG